MIIVCSLVKRFACSVAGLCLGQRDNKPPLRDDRGRDTDALPTTTTSTMMMMMMNMISNEWMCVAPAYVDDMSSKDNNATRLVCGEYSGSRFVGDKVKSNAFGC